MRIVGESVFDLSYLALALSAGLFLLCGKGRSRRLLLMGAAALTLGIGDAFHLVPRVYSLIATGETAWSVPLSLGKLVTSVTMTAFYVILYQLYREQTGDGRAAPVVYALAAARVAACLMFPVRQWFTPLRDAGLAMGFSLARNLPFAALGAMAAVLFYRARRSCGSLRFLWLAVLLSFAFYIPVTLWADAAPAVGALMLPKTICYVWMIGMFLRAFRRETGRSAK